MDNGSHFIKGFFAYINCVYLLFMFILHSNFQFYSDGYGGVLPTLRISQ